MTKLINESASLRDLRAHFLEHSMRSMPLAGAVVWLALGIAALWLPDATTGRLSIYVLAAIVPLAALLDLVQRRRPFSGGNENPLTRLFLSSIVGIGIMVPLVITAGVRSEDGALIVLGMAILAGIIWIPYGWAAGDPVGLRHAVARALGAYAAFAFAPQEYRSAAICFVVVLAYLYSLVFMRRPLAGRGAAEG
ncbi:MAG: hypothetical protein P8080_06645 [Gammaproteobacteria bacterium]